MVSLLLPSFQVVQCNPLDMILAFIFGGSFTVRHIQYATVAWFLIHITLCSSKYCGVTRRTLGCKQPIPGVLLMPLTNGL